MEHALLPLLERGGGGVGLLGQINNEVPSGESGGGAPRFAWGHFFCELFGLSYNKQYGSKQFFLL